MHTHSSQSSQHVLKMESLPFPERFLIWAIRVSFSSVMSTEESTHHLRQASRFVGVLEILPWVQSYIGVIGAVLHDSRVFVDIHSPACPMVGRDEWHLIQTLAALRASNRSLAEAHLEVFLPAKVIQVCTNCAVQLAAALDRAGWALQLMPVTKTELLVTGGVTHPATLHLSGAHAALNLTCSRRRRHCMSDKSFRSEPGQFIATTDAEQTLQQLRQLMCMIDASLPTLPPQFDVLLGNALLNLALMRLIAMHGQTGAANLLAASAEALWSDERTSTAAAASIAALNA